MDSPAADMGFPAAIERVFQGRKMTRRDWPGGSWVEMSPGTGDEAAHPVIAFADGSESVPFTYNLKDVKASDWTRGDVPLPGWRTRHDEAVKLLERALHLYRDGECAPGGTETLHGWARETEAYLRSLLPPGEMMEP